jgi:putative ABC transport system permease protein
MFSPRWRKVVRDLWGNKLRTLLVVLSIAVGVFAVGMIAGARVSAVTALDASWNSTDPASVTLYTDLFDEELLYTVRHMPGVRGADARRQTTVRFQDATYIDPSGKAVQALTAPDEAKWRNLSLYTYPDYEAIRVGRVWSQSGAWPPPDRQVLIERASLDWMGAQVGDTVLVKAWNGHLRELRIAGTIHDPGQMQASWNGTAVGFVDRDTMDWLGASRNFDELHVIAAAANPARSELTQLAQALRTKVEKSGRTVYYTYIPTPGKHPAGETVEPMLMILGVLGFLALILSGLLVVNTMQALLTQQVRQMGIMKAVGARNGQIMGIYCGMVVAFGVLALTVAVPLGALGAQGLTQFMAGLLNFNIERLTIPPQVLALEVAVGLAVPLLAALYPIITAARITPREAMSDYGLAARRSVRAKTARSWLRLPFARPTLLSLRNTFRRRGRLALTLATLILGGAIFIGVFSVRDSLLVTLDNMFQYTDYDAFLIFRNSHRIDQIVAESLSVPGITAAEGWRFDNGRRMRPDDTESDPLQVRGVPAASALIRPRVVEGRWLLPEDENAIVVNTMFLKDEPDVKLGSQLKLKLNGRETDWQVVGIAAGTPPTPLLHANYPYLAQVMGEVERAGVAIIVTHPRDPAAQAATSRALEEHFKSVGMEVSYRLTSTEERTQIVARFNVLIVFLMIMAVLLAVVGAIGLTGTMSLNVLERTREIGVMRAIGASDGSIFQIVVIEGLLIGLISWLCGAILAYPLGQILSNAIGAITMKVGLDYVYSLNGLGMWLVIASVLAVLASLLPARNASRVSVRDVLAYE